MILFQWPFLFLRLLFVNVILAIQQIWSNKIRSMLTMIGIIIGVASVTVVIALLSGLQAKIQGDFETVGTNKIVIYPERPHRGPRQRASWRLIKFEPSDFDKMLDHCPSIDLFTRVAAYSEPIRSGDQVVEGAMTNGIEPSWHRIESRDVTIGRPFSIVDNERARNVCIVTPSVRDKLHLDRDCAGQSIFIGDRIFWIVGVVEPAPKLFLQGGQEQPLEVFIPFGTAWQLREPVMRVIATSKSPEVSKEAHAEARFYLRNVRQLKPTEPDTFGVFVMEDILKIFNGIAMAVTMVASGIVGVSLIVGGVGIMNIMLVSVSERTREIGLRKAVGAKPSALLLQFLVEAVVLCFLGGVIGIVFAQLMTFALAQLLSEYLDKAFIPLWAILLAFGFSTFVGIVFGMFPAIKAANLDPIEALRHE